MNFELKTVNIRYNIKKKENGSVIVYCNDYNMSVMVVGENEAEAMAKFKKALQSSVIIRTVYMVNESLLNGIHDS